MGRHIFGRKIIWPTARMHLIHHAPTSLSWRIRSFLVCRPLTIHRSSPKKRLYHVVGVFRFCADSGTFACLRSKKKWSRTRFYRIQTTLQMSVFLILWYSDILTYLVTFCNAVSIVPHIPVGTLCTDHFEKVTASTAPKLWSLYYVYVWKYFPYVLTIYVAAQSCYVYLSIIIMTWIL